MVFRKRADGTEVTDLPGLRRVVPYVMPTRTESIVYFSQRMEVDALLAWLEDANRDRAPADRLTLFHVFLTAIARTVRLRPEVNRFVVGRRTYQHKDISISFIVKKAMTDEAVESEVRLVFTGRESVEDVRRMVGEAVHDGRGEQHRGGDDRLIDFFVSWPRPLLNAVAGLIRFLDYHNALPARLASAIPLYTSVYVVNAGSIGIDPPFHHLYELGSASAFVSLGRATRQPVVDADGQVVARWVLDVAHTLDERATDGFYFAKTAEVIRRLVEEPDLLAQPDVTVDELVPVWPPRR
ncbi:MAG: 2-oxo acid dehydrogenase subunit E2 [Nocardioides sp.]|nr:2-oxo acid dehydrogenase subunit E2 [Nocardioides sp.]